MCERCGCRQIIAEGKEAIRKQVVESIKELRLTPANVDDYECTETISSMIAPFGNKDDDVYRVASWIAGLHEGGRTSWGNRFEKHADAFRDLFARLPVKGDPKHITTTYHQLEQLARELDEATISSLAPDIQQAINAVNHVHEDKTRRARLQERYGL